MFNKEKLIQLMEEKKLSLTDVSKMCGIAYSTLRDIYTGKNKNPLANTLKKLSQGLGIDADYFIDLEENKNGHDWDITKTRYTIPREFEIADEARSYIKMHSIFGSSGFDVNKMSDEEVLNFANEMLRQAELISYKYKK